MYLIEEDRTRELGVGHFLHFQKFCLMIMDRKVHMKQSVVQ